MDQPGVVQNTYPIVFIVGETPLAVNRIAARRVLGSKQIGASRRRDAAVEENDE
jgi:hypothetical protein